MDDVSRILVFVPNWVGDVVMATAAMRAIRQRFAKARTVHLMRPYVADVLAGAGLGDEMAFWPAGAAQNSLLRLAGLVRQLRRERFDLAVLFTNSFRSAMVARLASVRRRVGYDRDGRGWLLTDRLTPPKDGRQYVPVPALDYYNDLARHVGCDDPGDRLTLATLPADEAAIDARLGESAESRALRGRPLVALNPGANYGSAKCWPAESYAAVSDALVERYGARVVASLGPKEREIADRLKAAARQPIDVFVDPPLGLGPLKALIRRCDLLITNDTGPRHFAAAFDVPVVTVFGSSDPAWTDTRFAKERIVSLDLECQPCMERTCPLGHHNCMRQLKPEAVLEKVAELLAAGAAVASGSR
ncbi:MAG TPA: lipopolysaccharide heptosyltransferase II [Phycisphaerae bacterium]|nr:lipopolysaccharide heptosyltransferase II [Phycisphaerae bacterium]